MKFDNRTKPIYTEVEAFRIAQEAAELAVQKVLAAMHLDKRIAQTQDNSNDILTVKQMASVLGISKPKAYELTRKKGFPSFHIGRRVLISRDMLMTWMQQEVDRKEIQ